MKKTFPIFRPGKYPQGEYTAADVKDIFEKYDPDFLSAPFTIDHKQDGPRWGEVQHLEFSEDGVLRASAEDMHPALRDAVKEKHYGRVSVEIYKNLPEKGRYLKAVSWLGVKAPQVKGLEGEIRQLEFEDVESESVDFEVEWDEQSDHFTLGDVVHDAPANETPPASSLRTTTDDHESFEELQSRIDALEAERDSLSDKFEQSEADRRQAMERLTELDIERKRMGFEQFLNEVVAFGQLIPAQRDRVMELLMALDSVEKFEQSDGSEADPVDMFKEFLQGLPKVLDAAEKAPAGAEKEKLDTTSYKTIAAEAEKYQQEQAADGKDVSIVAAVAHVMKNS